ncbi:ArsR/SmtB family transcription factor [Streptomyces sp. NPDC059582]|uniref:ArsR/SmtB family transcription factor n=1 Tax=Streptomyces sp. NPDC059582 TaxID=3346875 RepID=UPI00369079E7
MLRVHFTPHDLLNVRIAQRPDPLWELICSVCRLQTGIGPLEFGSWRKAARQRIQRDADLDRAVRPLTTLIPPTGYIPDFLTPSVTAPELAAGLDAVRATERPRVVTELSRLADSRRLPAWTTTLGRPGCAGLAEVTRALAVYFRALVEPHWPVVRALVAGDVGQRTQALLDGGTQALLDGLSPWARWNAPVLEVDYPVDRDLHLDGRGLLLVPSFFCWNRPTALANPELTPVLVYPVPKGPRHVPQHALVRLLGRTRAEVLGEVAKRDARTTSEVAGALGIALPSVSYQLGVLRNGGLVASRREGKFVLHSATPLGHGLLKSGPP